MTALAAARQQKKIGEHPLPEALEVPMAASKIWQGGIVVANSSGYAASASTGVGLYVLGVADETKDNSAGAAGDLKIKVTPGTFLFANSSSTDALTQADVGKDCFIVDDQTVARTSSNGTRSRAGRVHSVTSAGVYVTVGVPSMTDAGTLDVHVVAAADLSSKQYYIMKVTGSGADVADSAGMSCLGVLQNAPAAAAIAVVRVLGVTRCIAGGALATVGTDIATTAAGKAKAAVSGTTQGGVGDPVVGSFALGKQLTTAAGDTSAFSMVLLHQGALPGTAA